jgi:hypothetical protein
MRIYDYYIKISKVEGLAGYWEVVPSNKKKPV